MRRGREGGREGERGREKKGEKRRKRLRINKRILLLRLSTNRVGFLAENSLSLCLF
jgi:hypothetical protein